MQRLSTLRQTRVFFSSVGATLVLALGLFLLPMAAHAQDAPKLKITTNMGDIMIEVYPDKAPKTVANFLQYVKDKHYNGTIFHRVIPNFMIQGGGYDMQYKERTTRPPAVGWSALCIACHSHPLES